MSNSTKKIPYDSTPINREYNSPAKNRKPANKFSGVLIVSLLLVVVVAIGLVVYFLPGKSNNATIYATYNISATGNVSTQAASKSQLSSVCIGAGGVANGSSFSKTNLPTYQELFSASMQSRGSGVIIRLDKANSTAYILTCYHVVSPAVNAVFVCLFDSYTPVYGEVVGYSAAGDLAVVKVTDEQIRTTICQSATIADSTFITGGDAAIAVGNPQGFGFAVTIGVVSRPNIFVNTTNGLIIRALQVDTPINSGNSGGGLFDANGNLIGIIESKSDRTTIDNVAFAVHINTAINVANNIIEGKNLSYAAAGYTVAAVKPNKQIIDGKIYNFSQIKIVSVVAGSDADKAGLKEGDILLSVKHNDVVYGFNTEYVYDEIKYSINAGDKLEYIVMRGNSQRTITVTVSTLTA